VTVRLLEEHVVNQIAAGEVIERPASVVKELVENSLDAGATTLEVLLVDGGKQRIRVRDDGSGMREQDAMMALERHATSKIRWAEDLTRVGSLGFRGEALPSIAAVSRFQLLTRHAEEDEGHRVRVEGGTLTDVRKVGSPVGTEVDVRSLFFNVPARRKFLRTRGTELGHCMEALHRVALMRPDVDLHVRHGERDLLRAPRGDLQRRAEDVLGRRARDLVSVAVERAGVQVTGLASPPGAGGRSSAAGSLYLYVNGRWVKDRVLRRAVYQAYRELMPKGRYPLVILDVRVPPAQVDVNVHPTKAEVRFVSPREVTAALAEGMRAQLLASRRMSEPRPRPQRGGYQVDRPTLPLRSDAPWALPAHPDDDASQPSPQPSSRPASRAPASKPGTPSPQGPPAPEGPPPTASAATGRVPPLAGEPPAQTAPPAAVRPQGAGGSAGPRLRGHRLLGVAKRRWVLLETPSGVLVVDGGRAALALGLRGRPGAARLLVPARVTLPPDQVDVVLGSVEALAERGLEVARFGPREVAVKAVPAPLVDADPAQVVAVAARALHRGAPLVGAWLDELTPPAIDPEPHEVRTLLATVDEAGVAVATRRWRWEELP